MNRKERVTNAYNKKLKKKTNKEQDEGYNG